MKTRKEYEKNQANHPIHNRVIVYRFCLCTGYFPDESHLLRWSTGISSDWGIVVGEKNFGENNGHVYARRYRPDYYEQRVAPEGGDAFLSRNRRFRDFYGERYLDLMSFVTDDAGRVRVFTPDHHFISADCRHLSLGGAKFFAERIEWGRFLPMQ